MDLDVIGLRAHLDTERGGQLIERAVRLARMPDVPEEQAARRDGAVTLQGSLYEPDPAVHGPRRGPKPSRHRAYQVSPNHRETVQRICISRIRAFLRFFFCLFFFCNKFHKKLYQILNILY